MKKQFVFIFLLLVTQVKSQTNNYKRFYNHYSTRGLEMVYNKSIKSNIGMNNSDKVLKIFKNADSNSDGKISQFELQNYQNWLIENFKYKHNETALCPDDFIKQGGGDCEDFAIMTCCMLNYHNIVAYIANFGRVTVHKHAVCMAEIKKPVPPGMLYYTIQYSSIPNGIYIPIDYEKIGGLTAIDRRWKISFMSLPKNMFGLSW